MIHEHWGKALLPVLLTVLIASSMGAVAGRMMPDAAAGVAPGVEFRVNTQTIDLQMDPSVAMAPDGGFVVAWMNYCEDTDEDCISAQRYDASGNPQGVEFRVDSTYMADWKPYPTVAMGMDGRFVVAWESDGQDGDGGGIYAQRYDASGNPQGAEFRVNTYTTNDQRFPSIAMGSDGRFVVAWDSWSQDGDGFGIYSQRYDATGSPQGSEFLVNTYTAGSQWGPSMAMASDGRFVVAWTSDSHEGSWYDIYAQCFNASGNPQGVEFRVNTYTNFIQGIPSVAMAPDGRFVVAWGRLSPDDSSFDVYAQRYDASGNPLGAEFRVNTYMTDDQAGQTVAMGSDGRFVVAWESLGQDGDSQGIYAQRYDATGNPQGSEFLVNTYTIGSQWGPSMAMASDGWFVVAWASEGQDGSSDGIYAKRFECVLDSDCDIGSCIDGVCGTPATTTTVTSTTSTTATTAGEDDDTDDNADDADDTVDDTSADDNAADDTFSDDDTVALNSKDGGDSGASGCGC